MIRYYDETLKKVKASFLGLIKLENSNAESIFLAKLQNYLVKFKIPIENLIGLAADNVSVVQVLPNIYTLGCLCHSIHFYASASANKLPNSVEDFVRHIPIQSLF